MHYYTSPAGAWGTIYFMILYFKKFSSAPWHTMQTTHTPDASQMACDVQWIENALLLLTAVKNMRELSAM